MQESQEIFFKLCDIADGLAYKPAVDECDIKLKSMVLKCSTIFRIVSKDPTGPARQSLDEAISTVENLSSAEMGQAMLRYPDAQRAFTNLKYAAQRLN